MKGVIGGGDDTLSVGIAKIKPSGNLTPKVSSSQGGSATSNGVTTHNPGNMVGCPTGSLGLGLGKGAQKFLEVINQQVLLKKNSSVRDNNGAVTQVPQN
jgi:hypothetical protein